MESTLTSSTVAVSLCAWGTRQSLSTPGSTFQKFGGSTACYALNLNQRTLILEAGFGLRFVPAPLWEENSAIIVSSVAWDKIQGIPFTPSFYNPKLNFHLIGPDLPDRSFAQALLDQQRPELCPVPNFYQDGIGASVRVEGICPTPIAQQFPGLRVSVFGDGRSFIRIEGSDISLAYFPEGLQPGATTAAQIILLGMPPTLEPGQIEEWLVGCRDFVARNRSVRRLLVCNYLPWQDDAQLEALQSQVAQLVGCQFLQQGRTVELI